MSFRAVALSVFVTFSFTAGAADYPTPKEGDWIARDFKFHTGEVLPEVRLHYTTIGKPEGIPVIVLHGTGSSAQGMLTPAFAGEMFGPGQPLDAEKYFVILPDALGSRKIDKALRRIEGQVSAIQLCRHGGCTISPGRGRSRRQARATDHRQFNGRHEHVAVG